MNKQKMLPVSLNIAITMRAIEYAFRKNVNKLSVNIPAESFGMLMIAYYQNSIQQDIAKMMKRDKSAILRQIDALEKKNLVQRMVDTHDKRKNIIVITSDGEKFVKEIISKERKLLKILTQDIDTHEMKTFIKVLSLLKTNAEKN
ncbi:MAG: MarR family transcriptional regulator [Prevotellaceae bacterium]|jgi:DNA-binding MarR family transcriptional regulator|nr:MarR family transcriptional regulator [Prevotellaceae bacterium]